MKYSGIATSFPFDKMVAEGFSPSLIDVSVALTTEDAVDAVHALAHLFPSSSAPYLAIDHTHPDVILPGEPRIKLRQTGWVNINVNGLKNTVQRENPLAKGLTPVAFGADGAAELSDGLPFLSPDFVWNEETDILIRKILRCFPGVMVAFGYNVFGREYPALEHSDTPYLWTYVDNPLESHEGRSLAQIFDIGEPTMVGFVDGKIYRTPWRDNHNDLIKNPSLS